ncbi:MAG: DUF6666 family protein [Pirellulales bacterium]
MLRHQSARVGTAWGGAALVLLAVCGSTSFGQQQMAWERNHASPKPPVRVAGKKPAAKPQAAAPMASQQREGSARQASRPNGHSEVAFMTSESAGMHAVKPASAYEEYEYVSAPPPNPASMHGSGPCGCEGGGCELGNPYEIGCGCEPCGDPCGCCDACGIEGGCGCGDCCCEPGCTQPGGCLGGCAERGCVPLCLYVPPVKEVTVFGGVQGFKGPLDWNRDRGNFGFHEGINVGGCMAWLPVPGLGYQLGYRSTQSQIHGDGQRESSEGHTQHFATGGLFRRACAGLQGGVVYDWLRDERVESADFSQIRGEVGLVNPRGQEIGFTFGVHLDDSDLVNERIYQSTDWYLLYYRVKCQCAGEVRAFAGLDDSDRGVLGSDFLVAINNRWSLQGGFTYYIPDDNDEGEAAEEEGWNIGLSLVWNYGCRAKSSVKGMYRPMFNVADNGTMFIDDRP